MSATRITLIGGPTAQIEIGGFRRATRVLTMVAGAKRLQALNPF